MAAVARHPIVALIDDSSPEFRAYRKGVCLCRSSKGTHWVTIVGYGGSAEGTPYWIVKNSYGTAWGEGGYMRLARNTGGRNIFDAIEPVP
jgi:C1A family cysteine protease